MLKQYDQVELYLWASVFALVLNMITIREQMFERWRTKLCSTH